MRSNFNGPDVNAEAAETLSTQRVEPNPRLDNVPKTQVKSAASQ